MTATQSDTARLRTLLDRKRACLVQLRDLGAAQCTLAAGGALGELLQLLSVKQGVLAQLQTVQQELAPYRHDDPEARRWSSPAERAAAAQAVADCDALLAEIVAQEQTSEAQLRLRRDAAAEQLSGAHSAAAARDAYGHYAAAAAGQLDLRSDQ